MITRKISSKTEQLVVSPRHKPNNEQLKLCSDIFSCFIIIYCLVAKKNGLNLISIHLELAPTLKVQKLNKCPGRVIK